MNVFEAVKQSVTTRQAASFYGCLLYTSRNLMVVIAVALAAFLICFTGIVATSLTQMQRNQVLDTYEAVWRGVEENDIENLKGVPEFERVGGYYMPVSYTHLNHAVPGKISKIRSGVCPSGLRKYAG